MLSETNWALSKDAGTHFTVQGLGPRRGRLLAAACCRALLPHLISPFDEHAIAAIETIEVFADTGKSKAALKRARKDLDAARQSLGTGNVQTPDQEFTAHAALWAVQVGASENAWFISVSAAMRAIRLATGVSDEVSRRVFYPHYRDIAGKPRGQPFGAEWRTSTVLALAERMGSTRDFTAMPILADALQDAGCEDEAILHHCREAGSHHVRGCWAVDLVLGNE